MHATSLEQLNQFITTNLNEAQRAAVQHENGALLVIAVPGSGKTRVITTRIASLIMHHDVDPTSIVALTFTNKAAQEMKERITNYLHKTVNLPFIGTFHSYCLNLLKKYGHLHNLENFTILDAQDQQKIVHDILKRAGLNKQFNARQVCYQISQLKNKISTQDKSNYFTHPVINDIRKTYEHEKLVSRSLDFDDLLLRGLDLFTNVEFKKQFQKRISHVLVDEYQDTNEVQHTLLTNMALFEKKLAIKSVCVVGDEDQSIYSWRGATALNILHFQQDFKPVTKIKIEQNYRSVQPILNVANKVISHNSNRNEKKLWSQKEGSSRVHLVTCISEYQEAELIITMISCIKQQTTLDKCAVLYRTHAQSRAIEEALIKHSIPYKIIGGVQFYERKEIKDLLAYLRLVVNPYDFPSLMRIINCPTRGIGTKTEELIQAVWEKTSLTYPELLEQTVLQNGLTGTKAKQLYDFITLLKINSGLLPSKALEEILYKTSYLTFIRDSYEEHDAESRIENIKELLHAVNYLESQGLDSIEQFLYEVALMQDIEEKQEKANESRVLLMTLHAAKGLEFHTVILAGIEENLLPSTRSLQEPDALEEERRLFYVGITRAQEYLILSYAKFRYTYGQMVQQIPSRFIDELPTKELATHDCTSGSLLTIRRYMEEQLSGKKLSPLYEMPPVLLEKIKKNSIEENYLNSAKQSLNTPGGVRLKKNQPVAHKTYGIGIVQEIEQRGNATYVTVKFKKEIRKILASFLTIS